MNQEPSARATYERSREAALEARSEVIKQFFGALRRWLTGTTVTDQLLRPSRPSIAFHA